MKKIFCITFVGILSASMLLTSCDLFGTEDDEDIPEFNSSEASENIDFKDFDDPELENEADGAEPIMKPHKEEDFYGKWSATSDHAQYLFGNVDLSIRDDGTWVGNITEEAYSGKWKYDGSEINLRDTEGYINWKMYFVEDGAMMFKDMDDPEVALVLKKR